MKDDNDTKPDQESNDPLAKLLNLAGPSAEIPDEVRNRVYSNVRATLVRPKPRRRAMLWALPTAIAASVLAAFFLSDTTTTVRPHTAGTVVLASAVTPFAVGDRINVGDVIDTGDGGALSIALRGDRSLRVDNHTLLEIDATDEFTLISGRIYFDTGEQIYSSRHVTVNTASGTAVDVGTQFSVHYENANMTVAVREGRVVLADNDNTYTAAPGKQMTLRPGQKITSVDVPLTGPAWDWAVALAPAFKLDDQTLIDFLKWVSRETGLEIAYENDEVRAAAATSRLYGTIEGLTPLEAVDSVLATTKFSYSIAGNTVSIRQ